MEYAIKKRFIVIPILAVALHFLMSNILYFSVEKLFLDALHIPEEQFMKISYLGELLIYSVLIILFFTIYRLLWRKDSNELNTETNVKDSIISIGAGIGVSGVSLIWLMLAGQIPALQKSIEAMDAGTKNIGGGSVLGGFLIAVVSAPIIEEILFRGIIFKAIRKISPAWIAIAVSSVLFGIYHMNIVQAVYATFMGVVAGIIYEKKKNLIFPILVHFANNLIAFLQDAMPQALGEMINIIAIMMVIPLGYIIYRLLRYKELKE